MKGDYERARRYAEDSVSIFKASESGMTFRGPMALGIYVVTLDKPDLPHDILREAELLLTGNCLDHNYLDFFCPEAMPACLRAGDWDEVDRYAQALEDYKMTGGEFDNKPSIPGIV